MKSKEPRWQKLDRQNGARENQSKLCSDELQKSHKMDSSTGVDSLQRKLTFLHPRHPTEDSCIRALYVGMIWLPCTRVLLEGHGYPAPEYCWRDMVILYPSTVGGIIMVILHPNTVGGTCLSCTRVLLKGHSLFCTRELSEGHGYPVSERCWRDLVILHPSTVAKTR